MVTPFVCRAEEGVSIR